MTFVDLYHPALGNVHVLADSSAVSLYEAHGWVLSGGGGPTPDPINLTPALGDLRYVQLADRTTFVPFWKAAEAVTTGAVRVDATGHLITANSNRTTRSTYDATEQAAWTVVSGGGGSSTVLTVASTVTTAGALVAGKHNPVDATSGPVPVTLPTGAASGALIAAEKIDATVNAVAVTGNMRGVAGQSIPLLSPHEARLFVADSTGSWWPIADHRTKTSLDLAAAQRNIADGRRMVGSRVATRIAGVGYSDPNLTSLTYRVKHVAVEACADLRFIYGNLLSGEQTNPTPYTIKVAVELASTGVIYPVTWGGQRSPQIDGSNGVLRPSDPVAVELAAGDVFYTRVFVSPIATVNNTLAATATVGTNSFTTTLYPFPNSATTGPLVIGTASSNLQETVQIRNVTGTGPWTCTLATGTLLAFGHASGAAVGGVLPTNLNGYADAGEGSSGGDLADAGSIATAGALSSTLSSAAAAGDTFFKSSKLFAAAQFIIDAAGTAETVTVKQVLVSAAAPYTYQLTAPLASAHASGVTVATVNGYVAVYAPLAIVADRVGTYQPQHVIFGDSIPEGFGYALRADTSYLSLPLEGKRGYSKVAIGGERAGNVVPLAGRYRRSTLIALGDWVHFDWGTNDLFAGTTAAQLETSLGQFAAAVHLRGGKVVAYTVTPRTTSTDLWATTANQTVIAGGFETQRLAYNAWLNSAAALAVVDRVVDKAATVDSGLAVGGAATGLWVADGSGPYTGDGLHPTALGVAKMRVPIDALVTAGTF